MIRHRTIHDKPRGLGGQRRERVTYSNFFPQGKRWQEPVSAEEIRAYNVLREQQDEDNPGA